MEVQNCGKGYLSEEETAMEAEIRSTENTDDIGEICSSEGLCTEGHLQGKYLDGVCMESDDLGRLPEWRGFKCDLLAYSALETADQCRAEHRG